MNQALASVFAIYQSSSWGVLKYYINGILITNGSGYQVAKFDSNGLDVSDNVKTYNPFSARNGASGSLLYQSDTQDAFYNMGKRGTIINKTQFCNNGCTANTTDYYMQKIFDGTYENSLFCVPQSTTGSILVNFTNEMGTNGFVYTEGEIYVSFYYTQTPDNITFKWFNKTGDWKDPTSINLIKAKSASYAIYKITMPTSNWFMGFELNITGNRTSMPACLAEVEYHMIRPSNTPMPMIDKTNNQDILADWFWANDSNSNKLKITHTNGNIDSAGTINASNFMGAYSNLSGTAGITHTQVINATCTLYFTQGILTSHTTGCG